MERVVENDKLKVTVSDDGAELVSVWDKVRGVERIWSADPAVWGRHAPVLFPFEGKLVGGKYTYQGKEYSMTAHGFARDRVFQFVGSDETSITHKLESDDESLAIYPFKFQLIIRHVLKDTTVTVEWEIVNTDTEEILYGIGAHPGFTYPTGQKATDCAMKIFKDDKGTVADSLTYYLLDGSGCVVKDKLYQLALTDGVAPLTEHMFDQDALVVMDSQIAAIQLLDAEGQPYLSMDCPGFPYFGIWSKEVDKFLCLEPWQAVTDIQGHNGQLTEKQGMNRLAAGQSHSYAYDMTF